jgi:hypothetical protein
VRWSAVFSGAVISVAMAGMFVTLWLALSYASHIRTFSNHLDWWIGGTAIGATLLAGFLAAAISGTPGIVAGLANALATWALVVIGLAAAGIPAAVATGTVHTIRLSNTSYTVTDFTYWAGFWSVLIGFGAAALGGVIGGAVRRRNGSIVLEETSVTPRWTEPTEPAPPREPVPA